MTESSSAMPLRWKEKSRCVKAVSSKGVYCQLKLDGIYAYSSELIPLFTWVRVTALKYISGRVNYILCVELFIVDEHQFIIQTAKTYRCKVGLGNSTGTRVEA